MKIAIVGWGVEGQSAFRYFGPDHDYLIVNEEPRDDFPAASDRIKIQFVNSARTPGLTSNVDDLSYLDGIEACDKIFFTPTSRKVLEKKFPADHPVWPKMTSDRQIFFETVKTNNIIGITGTKGKGTTSTLTAKLLTAAGKKVFLGGNIGRALLDFVSDVQADDWVVIEMANFQLYKFDRSPHIAVCLMIAPEHMEWHTDMDEYVEAKANIFKHQKTDDIAIYLSGNQYSERAAGSSAGIKIPFFASPGARVREDGMIVVGEDEVEVVRTTELKLLGKHNWQNVCAAVTTVWQVDQNLEAVRQVLTSFSGLEHRLEFVRELDSVKYYDDSFGTTPDTLDVALKSFSQPVVLIAGGHDKGADYEAMAVDIIKDRVRHVIVIGAIAERLSKALRSHGFNNITFGLSTMPEIVNEARKQTQPGDIVLLSAGTSSFGLFRDYKDRGNQFKQAVQALSSTA
jgi:UDP-N-acetylmuramoylalanine--D-glutamate ligase